MVPDPGTLLATTHDAGGLRVRLRLARPSDALRLRAFLEAYSPELADHVGRFTFYDPRERLVLAATAPIDGAEEIVGLAALALPLPDRNGLGDADPLIVVDDRTPSHAVAQLLASAARSLARRVRRAA